MEKPLDTLQKANIIMLFLLLLGGIVFAGWLLLDSFLNYYTPPEGAVAVVASAENTPEQEYLHLANSERVVGANTELLYLTSQSSAGKVWSSGGYGGNDMRNILFLVGTNKQAHWLFPKHEQHIRRLEQIPQPSPEILEHKPTPTALLLIEYVTGTADTPEQQQSSNIALTKPDGSGFKTVLQGIRLVSYHMQDSQYLSMVYLQGNSLRHLRIAATTLETVDERELTRFNGQTVSTQNGMVEPAK